MPIGYSEFEFKDAKSSGGVTGSKRVQRTGGGYYQVKSSILDNSIKRQLRAGSTDQENFGEMIASKLARSLVIKDSNSFEAVPDVSLVYNEDTSRVAVASKYLGKEGEKVRTLDAYVREKNSALRNEKKHITFVDGKANPAKGEYDISGNANASLRKDIALGIAASIIVGDHDVNPGNFVVVSQKDGTDRAGRIDLGHAFNDLLNTKRLFGGQVRNTENFVLDFLNREEVGGLKLGSRSKLWRDYPGLIPSQEMADAFKQISEQSKALEQGRQAAQKEFSDVIAHMKNTLDNTAIKHVKDSLNALNQTLTGTSIDLTLPVERVMEIAFDNMQNFAETNQRQMAYAGRLMQLQVDIDNMLRTGNTSSLDEIKKTYGELVTGQTSPFKWIKTSADEPAYSGSLNSYIQTRREQLFPQRHQFSSTGETTPPLEAATLQQNLKQFDEEIKRLNEKMQNAAPSLKELEKLVDLHKQLESTIATAKTHSTGAARDRLATAHSGMQKSMDPVLKLMKYSTMSVNDLAAQVSQLLANSKENQLSSETQFAIRCWANAALQYEASKSQKGFFGGQLDEATMKKRGAIISAMSILVKIADNNPSKLMEEMKNYRDEHKQDSAIQSGKIFKQLTDMVASHDKALESQRKVTRTSQSNKG
jgi:hypothetical protein